MLSRRNLLRRVPAALAALPFLSGVAVLAPEAEPTAQPEAEAVYGWWQVMISGGKVVFHDIPEIDIDARGVWQYPEGALGDGIALAERNVLVRTIEGSLVRWGLDTGPNGWPVSP